VKKIYAARFVCSKTSQAAQYEQFRRGKRKHRFSVVRVA
jgi:hypothetical protein